MASKLSGKNACRGDKGEILLITGNRLSMRKWQELPSSHQQEQTAHSNDYETLGYVIRGRAVLRYDADWPDRDRATEEKSVPISALKSRLELTEGDSWIVPAGVVHAYEVMEHFEAIEATSPPTHA